LIYNPENYWKKRLSEDFNLKGVGHIYYNEHYNKWLYKGKIRALKKVLKLFSIDLKNKIICDIGSGMGFFINFYHIHKAKYILGIDITDISIEWLRNNYPEYHFIRNDISKPSLYQKYNSKFDIINVFDVIYHITDDEAFERAIFNIAQLAKKDGFIFITDLFGAQTIQAAEHVKFRDKKTYQVTFKENNLDILCIYPLYYLLNQQIFGKINILGFRRIGKRLDSTFSPLYYFLDNFLLSLKRSNLNLLVATKRQ